MPENTSTKADWRAYWATAIAMVIALILNVWTRNTLWTRYTMIGLVGLFVLFMLVRHYRIALPARAVWIVGIAMAMHYLGGSLSGLHTTCGDNGVYCVFPWWDNVVHLLGALAVAVAAAAVLLARMPVQRVAVAFLAACVGVTAGVLVELYEFAQFQWFGTTDQGFYTNTMWDLYDNTLGAIVGAVLYVRLTPSPAASVAHDGEEALSARQTPPP